EENEVPCRINNFGSYFYFSLPQENRMASLMYYLLRERGVHLQEGFPCFLTTAHSDRDLDTVVEAFRESIAEMQRGEALPKPARMAPMAADVEPVRIPLTEPQ